MTEQLEKDPTQETRTRYGACFGSGDWISGELFDRCDMHPDQVCGVAGHVSSSVGWSERDIRVFHHEKIGDGAAFVWLGHFTSEADFLAAMPMPVCTREQHPPDPNEVREMEA